MNIFASTTSFSDLNAIHQPHHH